MSVTEEQVREQLKQVIDPELFINIVDLGLIYTVEIGEGEAGDAGTAAEAEAPAAETPAAETPAAETPAAETPAAETPPAETPAAAEPAPEQDPPPAPGEEAPAPEAEVPAEPAGPGVQVKIEMTMTSPMCPAGPQLVANSKQVVSQLPGVTDVEVRVVMDPPWTPDRMTDDAKDKLGIF